MNYYGFNRRFLMRKKPWWHRFLPKSRISRLRLVSSLITVVFLIIIAATIITSVMFVVYSRDLPRPDKVRRTQGFSTIIYDRNGTALYDIFREENRVPIFLSDVPVHMQQATIAIEDRDFYKHKGFSQRGILRAIINTIFLGRLQGGSTLTQQLVKNVLLSSERTIPRKIKEFILAMQIERRYSKDEILQMYLNEASYGGATAGVEKAAEYYFDKSAEDLTLVESAILAGLPAAPTRYSPFNPQDDKAYIWRAEQVARRMREDGFISQQQEKEIKEALPNYQFAERKTDIKAAHFVFYVRDQLIEQFGEQMVESGGLRVTTTLDWELQKKAEEIVKQEVDKLKGLQVGNGAAVVINVQTGEILSMVGSKDYQATQGGAFNVVTQALRQPGSAIKPITYAKAFEKGFTASTVLFDVETHFPGGQGQKDYIPRNYDGKFRGPLQLRYALGNSINVVAVKLQGLVGVKEMLQLANQMGLSTLEPTDEMVSHLGLSVVLGGGDVKLLDLTSAFAVFAAEGVRYQPYAIEKVSDNKGKILWEYKAPREKRVMAKEIAYLLSSILSDNQARQEVFGSRSHLLIPGRTVAVKTGTTDDVRDNWTIGYTPSVAVGVWVGNNDNSPMNRQLVSGVTGAAPIWNRIMSEVIKGKRDEPFPVADNIISMEIDAFAGGLPIEGMPKRTEYFIKGTEPTDISPIYKKLKISKNEPTKLANPIEVAIGNFEEKEFFVFYENDPISTDGKNRWQEAVDVWLKAQQDSRYHPPDEVSQAKEGEVIVIIKSPLDKEKINSNDVRIIAEAASIYPIKSMIIEVDNSVKLTVSSNKIDEMINLTSDKHEIRIRARDEKDFSGDSVIRIGVNVPWDFSPTVTPQPTNTPTPTPTP